MKENERRRAKEREGEKDGEKEKLFSIAVYGLLGPATCKFLHY